MKIFLSYTTRDPSISVYLLSRVAQELSEFGELFVDALDNNSINHQAEVENQLLRADVIVALESDFVVTSPWMMWELRSAGELRIPILRLKSPYEVNSSLAQKLISFRYADRTKDKNRVLTSGSPRIGSTFNFYEVQSHKL